MPRRSSVPVPIPFESNARTQGSLILKNSPLATENASVIDSLEAAGAVMPFQTTVPEFYLFPAASTRAWGTTRNPWNLDYSPGGSSAGSGAALAGFATLAIGSDMGGSIRIPASQCSRYGYRPTFGRVASGEIPYSTSGPMARRFDDLVHFQNAIVGPSDKIMAGIRPRLDFTLPVPGCLGMAPRRGLGRRHRVELWTANGFKFALTWPWNILNRYPIVDVPLGVVEDRMPTGMQVIGQTFTDLDTFQLSYNWSRLRQPLFAAGRFPTFA